MSNPDLNDLISRTAMRDRPAFSQLYQHTSAKLFGICLRILKDRPDAEEALQEIYVKIWRNSDRFATGGASALGWVSAIARNHAIDRLRARKPAHRDIDEEYDLADKTPDPEAQALAAGEQERIMDCMNELEEDRADAVISAYVEGYSYKELAERHDVPLNTMRTWLRRSLISLRECLEK